MRVMFALAMSVLMVNSAYAEETVVSKSSLPGVSMEQRITYSTTKADYEATRADVLRRLRKNDASAMLNPENGPWMRVETTAMIGIAIKGIGIEQGRVHLRQITAAEEALYLFEKERPR